MSDPDDNNGVPQTAIVSSNGVIQPTEQVEPKSTAVALSSTDQPSKAGPRSNTQPQSFPSIDALSKASAIVLVLLYMSGFLITSLHDFRFGFSEMNPLRPRILAAGSWVAIFIAVPFAFVWELRKHWAINHKGDVLNKASALIAAYMGSALFIVNFSGNLFSFDSDTITTSNQPSSSPPMWAIVAMVVGGVLAIFIVVAAIAYLASKIKLRPPKWVVSVAVLLFYGYIAVSAYLNIFVKHSFKSNAMYFWIFMVGGFIYFECSQRGWTLTMEQWHRSLIGFLIILTVFATVYYPHIKAKWGGGALIPVELTFSKDASLHPTNVVDCSLIDETDAGFYLVAKGESSATFIPRTEITSIYYGQGNKHALLIERPPSAPKPPDLDSKSATAAQPHVAPSTPESPARPSDPIPQRLSQRSHTSRSSAVSATSMAGDRQHSN